MCAPEPGPNHPHPVVVENILPPLILIFVEEVFSMMLSPEDYELKFLPNFRGLASTSTYVEV
jgi:hypothetical protein